MKNTELLPVNTPVWVVTEHFYYIPEEAAPRREFTVCPGYILRHSISPARKPEAREPEAVISYLDADGFQCLTFVRRSRLKDSCFETPQAAAEKARKMTEFAESRSLERFFGEKMRRPWEKYLMEE